MKRIILSCVMLLCAASSALAWRGEVGWTFEAGSGFSSGAAVTDSLVIAGDETGMLYAVHKSSGREAWSYKGTNTVVGTPSIVGSTVICAQADGTVTCLNIADGTKVWEHVAPEMGYASETISDGTAAGGGKVFFVRGDGKLYALNASSGETVWVYESAGALASAPLYHDGMLYLGEQGGVFSAIDPSSGKRMWGGGAGGQVNTPSCSGGSVFYSSWDGSVQRVQIKGVIPLWKDSMPNLGEPVTTAPTIGGGRVYVGTANGKIAALSEKDGSILWTFDTQGGSVSARPILSDGLVFAGGGQGVLFVLDAATGRERYTFTTEAGINGTPALDGGVIYLAGGDGRLYAIM